MTKRAKLSDRGPLLSDSRTGRPVDILFEKTTPDDTPQKVDPAQHAHTSLTPSLDIKKDEKEPLQKLISYITPQQNRWIEKYAEKHGVSKARVVRHMVDFFIASVENDRESTQPQPGTGDIDDT